MKVNYEENKVKEDFKRKYTERKEVIRLNYNKDKRKLKYQENKEQIKLKAKLKRKHKETLPSNQDKNPWKVMIK